MPDTPILYSFRRCPYAIRARMALAYAGVTVELREVLLAKKPAEMLAVSAKGTVPVLVLPDGRVIDESVDVMHWALARADPDDWYAPGHRSAAREWVASNDGEFKSWLDRYKYADRYPQQSAAWYRGQTEAFLSRLNGHLAQEPWLAGERMGFADVALFPFLRQFAMVDRGWFEQCPHTALRRWLEVLLAHPLFTAVMRKHPRWEPGQTPVRFPDSAEPEPRA